MDVPQLPASWLSKSSRPSLGLLPNRTCCDSMAEHDPGRRWALFGVRLKLLRSIQNCLIFIAHVSKLLKALGKMANSGGGQFSDDAQFSDRFTSPGGGKLLAKPVSATSYFHVPFSSC